MPRALQTETFLAVKAFSRTRAWCGGCSFGEFARGFVGKKAPSAQEFFVKVLIDSRQEEKWAVVPEGCPQNSCSWTTSIITYMVSCMFS